MALLSEDVARRVRGVFDSLENPVRLAVFSQALADPSSEDVLHMARELVALHPQLSLESFNFVLDKDKADSLGIVRTPAIAFLGAEKDHGIRFYGLPSGYEFGTVVETILDVSRGDGDVAPATKTALDALERPVHIQVFSTPT